jgi:hypothetical protein
MNNYDKIKRNLFLSKDKQDTLSVGEREMSRRWANSLIAMSMHILLMEECHCYGYNTNAILLP